MELDALLLLTRILKDYDFTVTELLIVESYIVNKNVNIHLSIRDNAQLFLDENNVSIDDCKELREIVVEDSDHIYIPIYKLLLKDVKLRNFVVSAVTKKALDDKTILDIVEEVLLTLDELESVEEQSDLIRFLMGVLEKRRFTKKNIMQESRIINEYVKKNEYTILNENDRKEPGYDIRFFRRMLLYKLFSCGYVSFDYNQKLDPNSLESGVKLVVEALIKTRGYGHLRLMFGRATLTEENVQELKLVMMNVYKEMYSQEVSESDAEKDKAFIDKVNIFLKSVDSEILSYEELTKKDIGITL